MHYRMETITYQTNDDSTYSITLLFSEKSLFATTEIFITKDMVIKIKLIVISLHRQNTILPVNNSFLKQ